MTRRRFLGGTALMAGLPFIVSASALGRGGRKAASERITMGCIGAGGKHYSAAVECQGTVNMKAFLNQQDVQVLAVCDVDSRRRVNAGNIVREYYGRELRGGVYGGCEEYNDFRELIARDDIDALSIALPDHWHSIPVIMGAKMGKDIYAEKPLALTVPEGRAMVEAVKRYGVVFQTGSQLRSDYNTHRICELVRNGRIGKLHTIRAVFAKGPSIGPQREMDVPEGFDYNMWLGPAPWAPYTDRRCHYDFRWILDYSAGQITDHGAHYCDIGQWGNGTELTGPVEVEGRGEFPSDGLWNTATTYHVEWTYENGVKMIGSDTGRDVVCITFEGTEGWVHMGSQLDAEPKSILTSVIGPDEIHLYESKDHHRNFLDCVRTRNEPIAPIEAAQRSATFGHIGNIAMMLKRKLRWDPDKEEFVGDDEANRMLSRGMRSPWHL